VRSWLREEADNIEQWGRDRGEGQPPPPYVADHRGLEADGEDPPPGAAWVDAALGALSVGATGNRPGREERQQKHLMFFLPVFRWLNITCGTVFGVVFSQKIFTQLSED
jgi:hypothetical protein